MRGSTMAVAWHRMVGKGRRALFGALGLTLLLGACTGPRPNTVASSAPGAAVAKAPPRLGDCALPVANRPGARVGASTGGASASAANPAVAAASATSVAASPGWRPTQPARPLRMTRADCHAVSGVFVRDGDPAPLALQIWLPPAQAGDPVAQNRVGELYERGIGSVADPASAALWYRRAADQGEPRALVNLGALYERGEGVPRDPARAAELFRRAGLVAGTPPEGAAGGVSSASVSTGPGAPAGTADPGTPSAASAGRAARTSVHIVEPPLLMPRAALEGRPARLAWPGPLPERPAVTLYVRGGRAEPDAPSPRLRVNGRELQPESDGSLRVPLDFRQGRAALNIEVIDPAVRAAARPAAAPRPPATRGRPQRAGPSDAAPAERAARLNLTLQAPSDEVPAPVALASTPSAAGAPAGEPGISHALIIANAAYTRWDKLDTPIQDGQDLRDLLERRFGYATTLLVNATRYDIFAALAQLRSELKPRDRLLVFYAGHGDIEPRTRRGYWVPINAGHHDRSQWISVLDVADQLDAIAARQVLVIADSCYAGALAHATLPSFGSAASPALRGARPTPDDDDPRVARLRARVALTSGALEPVVDGGGGRNSLFMRSLLDVLGAVQEPLPAARLFDELAAHFALRAARLKVKQQPQFAAVRQAGHELGDYWVVPAEDGRRK